MNFISYSQVGQESSTPLGEGLRKAVGWYQQSV